MLTAMISKAVLFVGAHIERAQNRQFHAARSAPACPECDDDVAAAIVGEGDGMAVERGKGKGGGGLVKRKVAGVGARSLHFNCLRAPGEPNREQGDGGNRESRSHVKVIIAT